MLKNTKKIQLLHPVAHSPTPLFVQTLMYNFIVLVF